MSTVEDPLNPDAAWLDAALVDASIPTLACVLVHLTGERRWIEGRYAPSRARGMDDNDSGGLPDAVQDEIRQAARAAIGDWLGGKPPVLANPSDSLLVEMMSVSLGEQVPADYAPMIREDLALSPLPDELHGDVSTSSPSARNTGVWNTFTERGPSFTVVAFSSEPVIRVASDRA